MIALELTAGLVLLVFGAEVLVRGASRIAAALGITAEQVGIKATTNETMGFVGRNEGIAALASAMIQLPNG